MAKKFLALSLLLVGLQLSGCGSLFYWPEPGLRGTPDQLGMSYRDVYLESDRGNKLHGWFFPAAGESKGLIYFLHGNAENISTHFAAMTWVTRHDWDMFILDYRGYGLSEGSPDLQGVHHDAYVGLRWALDYSRQQGGKLVVFGQSIGGATAATLASRVPEASQVDALILDSPFANYRQIAREKAAEQWLTWPLQYPLSWLFSNKYSPELSIKQLPQMPLLIMHSCNDRVVGCHHGQKLFTLAKQPKDYWQDEKAPHTAMLNQLNWRRLLIGWLEQKVVQAPAADVGSSSHVDTR